MARPPTGPRHGWSAAFPVATKSGIAQGFSEFRDLFAEEGAKDLPMHAERSAENVTDLGLEILDQRPSVDTILARVSADESPVKRPLLAGDDVRATIGRLLAERAEAYGRFVQVATDGRTPNEIVAEIVDRTFNRSV